MGRCCTAVVLRGWERSQTRGCGGGGARGHEESSSSNVDAVEIEVGIVVAARLSLIGSEYLEMWSCVVHERL
jgi:hypothetical protein